MFGAEGVLTAEFTALMDALTTAITPGEILTVLAAIIGVGMGFVLMWFGVRKLIAIFVSAVFKGKIRS